MAFQGRGEHRVAGSGPEHHPGDDLLGAHVFGSTPWAADLCVRVHVESCARCRERVVGMEAEEAAFADLLPDAPMEAGKLQALVERLAEIDVAPRAPFAKVLGDVVLPDALSRARLGSRRWLKPGLWFATVKSDDADDWRVFLLRAPAGQRLPMHGHSGPELVCVLTGAFQDGERYAAGDFVHVGASVRHGLVVTDQGPCACLIATKGPLKWGGQAPAEMARLRKVNQR